MENVIKLYGSIIEKAIKNGYFNRYDLVNDPTVEWNDILQEFIITELQKQMEFYDENLSDIKRYLYYHAHHFASKRFHTITETQRKKIRVIKECVQCFEKDTPYEKIEEYYLKKMKLKKIKFVDEKELIHSVRQGQISLYLTDEALTPISETNDKYFEDIERDNFKEKVTKMFLMLYLDPQKYNITNKSNEDINKFYMKLISKEKQKKIKSDCEFFTKIYYDKETNPKSFLVDRSNYNRDRDILLNKLKAIPQSELIKLIS